MTTPLPVLALTMGEPAGIGPDLILRLYARRAEFALPPFLVTGHPEFLRARARRLGMKLPLETVAPEDAASTFASALPVVDIGGLVPDKPGDPTGVSASAVIEAIQRAVALTLEGQCRGIVTAPIHKGVLYAAGFRHPGHTEFIAALCANGSTPRLPVMMLAHDDYRVVPATIHVPISAVPSLITGDLIARTCRATIHDLRTRFGIERPRLAVTGLNPHAGEGGTIGTEDLDVIRPAIAGLALDGYDVVGPVPADTVFHPPHWLKYDAVVAMYHDQALVPIKTVAFEDAVNVTLGLQVVRTSPDHGTAFDLAGSGGGSHRSMLAALRLADRLTGGRG